MFIVDKQMVRVRKGRDYRLLGFMWHEGEKAKGRRFERGNWFQGMWSKALVELKVCLAV